MSFAAMRRRRTGALASAYVPPTGNYSRLAPRYATLPTGITFSGSDGRYHGTVIDTTEPTWAVTDSSLTDTGNVSTNLINLNAKVASYAASMTGNTRILVPYTSRHAGTLVLPASTTGYWIGIYTSHYSSLPALSPGTSVGTQSANRVGPSHLAHMPEFYATGVNESAILTTAGTSQKYFLRGLYASNRLGIVCEGSCIDVHTPYSSVYPSDITLAQLYADGGGYTAGMRRAVGFGGQRQAIVDSYIVNVGSSANDNQGVLMYSGAGPYKHNNCHTIIGGASENVMAGGYGLDGTDATFLPSDIEVRGNLFEKPSFQGAHKNCVEVKLGRRWLVEGNVMTGQTGISQIFAIVVKLTDQSGGNLATDTSDVTIANNRVLDGPGGIVVSGGEFYSGTNTSRRVDIKNNVVFPLTVFPGRAFQFSGGNTGPTNHIDVQWNTGVSAPASLNIYAPAVMFSDYGASDTFTLQNNVLVGADGNSGVVSHASGGGIGETAFANAISNGVFTTNLVNYTSASYASQVRVADMSSVGFVDLTGRNLALSGASSGHAAGTGGFDLGADFALNTAIISGVT